MHRAHRGPAGALTLLTSVLTLSCSSTPRGEIVSGHMFSHFSRIGEVQSALIMNDLAGAQRPARWLSENISAEGLGEDAVSAMTGARTLARAIANARSIQEAAARTAELGAACGQCHEATGGGPDLALLTEVPTGGGVVNHMRRHLWGADRMWEGLVAPSDTFWSAGASVFTEMPLLRNDWENVDAAAAQWANRLHGIGLQAATRRTIEERSDAYAEMLRSCAGCHARLNVGS